VPLGTKEPTLPFLCKGTLSFTRRSNEEIHPKFSWMPETDTRVEIKKLVEATVSCLFLPFQSGQLVILFVELMVVRLWPTWHNAAVWERERGRGWLHKGRLAGGSAGRWPRRRSACGRER